MRFCWAELDIGEPLHQVSPLSLGDEPVVSMPCFHTAWTYRGIIKGMFTDHIPAQGTLTLA